jgi:hypothetical protein
MNDFYDSRKITRATGARQCGGALKISGLSIDIYGMLGRGAQKKSDRYFSFTQSSRVAFHCCFFEIVRTEEESSRTSFKNNNKTKRKYCTI